MSTFHVSCRHGFNSSFVGRISSCLVILLLAACASSPYEEGKSPADVPAHVNVVQLRDVYMGEFDSLFGSSKETNGDRKHESAPSQNDQEVTLLAKTNIVSQFTSLGYSIVEGSNANADIGVRFALTYQPGLEPLAGRTATVTARAYDVATDTPIFHVFTHRSNETGNLLGNLVASAVGSSREEMVAQASREAVINLVKEMRKGTKENRSVRTSSLELSHQLIGSIH